MTQERFIDLIRTEQEPLRRFLLGLCSGNASLADDIAQDALVRAYVASGSFLGLSKFSTWLFRIAYNCFVDHCRKATFDTVSDESFEAQCVMSDDSTDDTFRYQQLYQALDKIPEKERAAIVLHYFEDHDIKEISSIMQIPSGTVKYLLSTGRNHLKEHLSL
jgi:RNA polymerase sigma-70 factor (ECF subfamily)